MENFLSWLWDKASRVYEFFQTLYHKIRDAAIGVVDWIRSAAGNALYWAKYHAEKILTAAKLGLEALINGVASLANALFERAKSVARGLFELAKIIILTTFNRAVAAAQALVNGVIALAEALFNRAIEVGKGLIELTKIILLKALERASQAAMAIINGIGAILDALLKRSGLDDLWAQSALKLFLEGPIAFIFAAITEYFMVFLSWIIGSSMGAVKADMPGPPRFLKNGGGPWGPVGPGPGPGASGLAPPLKVLWRSGWPFKTGHPGIDLGLGDGTPVYAMHGGQVLVAGWSNVGYGYQVVLRNDEWWTRYAHLKRPTVDVGDTVKMSDNIGLGDTTGNSTGNHLHLEIKHRGKFIDPVTVLKIGGA